MPRRWPIPRLVFARAPVAPAGRADAPDDARFRTLVLPHLEAAWNYASYLTRDADVAEDIVQDAFLRAFRARETCRGDAKAWLMAILRNCWHDWLRKHRPQSLPVDGDAEPVETETPHSLLERQSDANHLRAMLAMLPEPFREVLVLRELEEMSYREIAEVTRTPIGTVMSRLARAREMLATLVLEGEANAEKGRITL